METLNLDCDSYQDHEIELLLHLKSPYQASDIQNAKQTLAQQLMQNSRLGAEKQREILFFLDTIAQRITNKIEDLTRSGTWTDKNNNRVTEQNGSTFLIENPNRLAGKLAKMAEGRISITGAAPPGYLNPLNVRTISQAISIDTRFRPNYYNTLSTNFHMALPAIEKNVVSMRVVSIELPMTYYAISQFSGNATCLIISNATPTSGWLLTLPDGNYESPYAQNSQATDIVTALNAAITAAQPGTLDTGTGQFTIPGSAPPLGALSTTTDLKYKLNQTSGKSEFDNVALGVLAGGYTLRFNVDNTGSLALETNIQMRLGWQLGFRAAEYISKNTPVPAATLISEGICLPCGPRYGFLSINDYQKNTGPAFVIAYANSIMQDNIITRLNLAAYQADVGVYQISGDPGLTNEMNRTREYFGPVDIQKLHITLYDEYSRIINLNNMDWSFTLNFERLYD